MDMMDDFGDGFDEIDAFAADENFFLNASATFETLAQQPPHQAYPFDDSRVGEAQRVEARVLSPFTGEELEADNIVFENHADGRPPERAYWIGRKLLDCIYGCIRVCTILEYRNDEFVPWQTTNQRAAVKVMSWHRIQSLDHAENPISEIAALQHVCRDGQHDHVMGALDVLQDDDYLLVFMPYFASGSLYDFVSRAERFPENVARYWFRQIIDGLAHLQRVGVCHRDLSLENVVIDEFTQSAIIDLGMCLRVPYHCNETGGVTDVTRGSLRRLLLPSGAVGKMWYMAPEVVLNKDPFDGFSVDIWATGVILFLMLVGRPPWELAADENSYFRQVAVHGMDRMPDQLTSLDQCGLGRLVQVYNRTISLEAADLLQRILVADPRQRYSLVNIQDHPWFDQEHETQEDRAPNEPWRNDGMQQR